MLIGNAGAEFGVRGYVSALRRRDGEVGVARVLRSGRSERGFESKALEAAAKTWHGEYWKTGGGGTTWDPIVYDPDLDLVYFGTGNGSGVVPRSSQSGRRRQSFLASILAVRGQTTANSSGTSGHARRQLGLRRHAAADSRRPRDPRSTAKGRHAGVEERIFLRARSADGSFISATPFVSGISWATHWIRRPAARWNHRRCTTD